MTTDDAKKMQIKKKTGDRRNGVGGY